MESRQGKAGGFYRNRRTKGIPVDVEDGKTQKEVVPQTNTASNSDANKEGNNTGLYILAAVLAIVLLFTLVISNSKQNNPSEVEATVEEVEEVDTLAMDLSDD